MEEEKTQSHLSQTHAPLLMEIDRGSAFQSTLEISTTLFQVPFPFAASAAASEPNIWTARQRQPIQTGVKDRFSGERAVHEFERQGTK